MHYPYGDQNPSSSLQIADTLIKRKLTKMKRDREEFYDKKGHE